VFLFHNQECVIDATRPIDGDFEYYVNTVEGKSVGWISDWLLKLECLKLPLCINHF
jgi:hypothetical protein